MLQFDVNAKVRQTFGKGAARRLRAAKMTPAILYGNKVDNVPLELDTKSMTKTLVKIQDQNAVITLNIDGVSERPTRHVMVKEVQVHPVRDSLVHADFYEISLEEPLTLLVPLKISGKAKGVDMGGEMQVLKDRVQMKGLVLDIPDFIEVDVSPLGLSDKITCADLAVPQNVTLEENGDDICIYVQDLTGSVVSSSEEEAE